MGISSTDLSGISNVFFFLKIADQGKLWDLTLLRMALFVGRLPRDCRPRELEDLFHKYGRITRCDVKRGGYGFVEYEDPRDAEDAIKALDGVRFLGDRIVVEWARGAKKSSSEECFKCGKTGHWARNCPLLGGAPASGVRDRDRDRERDRGDRQGGDRYSRDRHNDYERRDRDRPRSRSRSRSRDNDRDRDYARRDRSRSPVR